MTRDVSLAEQAAGGEGDPKAQRLLSELRVSLDFFTREHLAATVPRVILVGDEGLLGPWQPWLADQLQCAVEIGSDLLRARVAVADVGDADRVPAMRQHAAAG